MDPQTASRARRRKVLKVALLRKREWDKCARLENAEGILHWFSKYAYAEDPDYGEPVPFRPYEFQAEQIRLLARLVREVRDGSGTPLDGAHKMTKMMKGFCVNKSREVGETWLLVLCFLWLILFLSNAQLLMTSEKFELVEDGSEKGGPSTTNSLLGKVRFAHRVMRELHPDVFPESRFGLVGKRGLLTCQHTKSSIKGTTSTATAGRSGRYLASLNDEYAFHPHSRRFWAALTKASRINLLVSTPNGRGNQFADVWHDPESSLEKIRVHWTQYPPQAQGLYYADVLDGEGRVIGQEPRSPYYDDYCRNHTPDDVARELDGKFEGSARGAVYKAFRREIHTYDPLERLGPEWKARGWYLADKERGIVLNEHFEIHVGWDFGIGVETAIVSAMLNKQTGEVLLFDCYQARDQAYTHFAERINAQPWQKGASHWGDPAGDQRESDKRSYIKRLRPLGIRVRYRVTRRVMDGIGMIIVLLQQGKLKVASNCEYLIEALENYRWATDNDGIVIKDKIDEKQEWRHAMDALRYLVTNALKEADVRAA